MLLIYCLLLNFIKPIHVDPTRRASNILLLLDLIDKPSYYKDLGYKPTNNELAKTNISNGTYILALTLVYPSLYNKMTRKTKTTTTNQSPLTTGLIILICLMLSSEVHPCPVPAHTEKLGEATPAIDSCVIPTLQVCSTSLPQCSFGHHSNPHKLRLG